jgi:hypothetical protein
MCYPFMAHIYTTFFFVDSHVQSSCFQYRLDLTELAHIYDILLTQRNEPAWSAVREVAVPFVFWLDWTI